MFWALQRLVLEKHWPFSFLYWNVCIVSSVQQWMAWGPSSSPPHESWPIRLSRCFVKWARTMSYLPASSLAESTPATLEQNYVVCELHQKVNMLFSFIRSHLQKKVIVFFACCKEVQYLFRVFCRLRPGMPILALHGRQQQMKRVEVYNDFIKKKNAVLFAYRHCSQRPRLPCCPEDANTYIHRVGQTARYKEGGSALLFLLPSEEESMLSQLQEKKVPINRIQVNPEKLTSVQQKLEAFLAQEKEQKERAQRCFVSYLRSVYLMTNKEVFDVFQLKLQEYAASLGLAVAPRVRFLNKAQKQRADPGQNSGQGKVAESEEEDEKELKSFEAQLRGDGPSAEVRESQSSEEEVAGGEKLQLGPKGLIFGPDEEEDEDLRDLDLLTVKRKDVFSLEEVDQDDEESDSNTMKKTEKEMGQVFPSSKRPRKS